MKEGMRYPASLTDGSQATSAHPNFKRGQVAEESLFNVIWVLGVLYTAKENEFRGH